MSLELSAHNASVLAELEEGDMVEFPRGWYSHWGVYVGRGRVIHLTGDNDGIKDGKGDPNKMFSICGMQSSKGYVKEEAFRKVAEGSNAKKNNGKDSKCQPLSRRDIVQRARDKLGEIGYNVLWKNCEHFAAFCRYGVAWSQQADNIISLTTVAAVVGAVGGIATAYMTRGNRR